MSEPDLSIRNLSLSAGDKNILRNIDFELHERSITALMGPMGGGKSSFLKFLAGESGKEGLESSYDQALYRGRNMGKFGAPRYIRQKTRESAASPEQSREMMLKRLAELNAVCRDNNDTICIDEPTAGLSDDDGAHLMKRLREASADRAVLIVSHNKDQVREFCDRVALFGGGRLLEHASREEFFASDEASIPGYYLRTGGVDLPSDETPMNMRSPEHRPLPQEFDTEAASRGRPTWIIRDTLDIQPELAGEKPDHIVLQLSDDMVRMLSPIGKIMDLPWKGGGNRPDEDRGMIVRICRTLDALLKQGARVTIVSGRNISTAAAVVGSLMVLRGSSPERAIELTALKFPDILLGMRIEQLFWDIDLDFSGGG